jgi:hypothetical protein
MTRPPEYDNLLRVGHLKKAVSSRESIGQFVRTAEEMKTGAELPMPNSARFFLAYEGMFSMVMAVLEHFEVRPGDGGGHRATAIGRVAADLTLSPAKQSTLTRLHDIRNRVTYRAPLPPISKADADAMQTILNDMLDAAKTLLSR